MFLLFHIFVYFATKKSEIVYCLDFSSISAFFLIIWPFFIIFQLFQYFATFFQKNEQKEIFFILHGIFWPFLSFFDFLTSFTTISHIFLYFLVQETSKINFSLLFIFFGVVFTFWLSSMLFWNQIRNFLFSRFFNSFWPSLLWLDPFFHNFLTFSHVFSNNPKNIYFLDCSSNLAFFVIFIF
jgi:hypothetical protein